MEVVEKFMTRRRLIELLAMLTGGAALLPHAQTAKLAHNILEVPQEGSEAARDFQIIFQVKMPDGIKEFRMKMNDKNEHEDTEIRTLDEKTANKEWQKLRAEIRENKGQIKDIAWVQEDGSNRWISKARKGDEA